MHTHGVGVSMVRTNHYCASLRSSWRNAFFDLIGNDIHLRLPVSREGRARVVKAISAGFSISTDGYVLRGIRPSVARVHDRHLHLPQHAEDLVHRAVG